MATVELIARNEVTNEFRDAASEYREAVDNALFTLAIRRKSLRTNEQFEVGPYHRMILEYGEVRVYSKLTWNRVATIGRMFLYANSWHSTGWDIDREYKSLANALIAKTLADNGAGL